MDHQPGSTLPPALTPPTFPDGEIDKFLQRRVCARCYGDLQKRPAADDSPYNHSYEVFCPTCGDAWHYATISILTAEQRGSQAISELHEVTKTFRGTGIIPNPHEGKTQDQLLAELGF
jgi:hypothetical protein